MNCNIKINQAMVGPLIVRTCFADACDHQHNQHLSEAWPFGLVPFSVGVSEQALVEMPVQRSRFRDNVHSGYSSVRCNHADCCCPARCVSRPGDVSRRRVEDGGTATLRLSGPLRPKHCLGRWKWLAGGSWIDPFPFLSKSFQPLLFRFPKNRSHFLLNFFWSNWVQRSSRRLLD